MTRQKHHPILISIEDNCAPDDWDFRSAFPCQLPSQTSHGCCGRCCCCGSLGLAVVVWHWQKLIDRNACLFPSCCKQRELSKFEIQISNLKKRRQIHDTSGSQPWDPRYHSIKILLQHHQVKDTWVLYSICPMHSITIPIYITLVIMPVIHSQKH